MGSNSCGEVAWRAYGLSMAAWSCFLFWCNVSCFSIILSTSIHPDPTIAFSAAFVAQHKHSRARVMRICTPHGECLTPMFMPVGTRAGVNNVMPEALRACQSQMILGGNTYHMLVSPGSA